MASKAVQSSTPGTLQLAYAAALDQAVATVDPAYLRRQRWFASKSKPISRVSLKDHSLLQTEVPLFILALIEIEYSGFEPEVYSVPLMITDRPVPQLEQILELKTPTDSGFVYEALGDDEFCRLLLRRIAEAATVSAMRGDFVFDKTAAYLEPKTWTVKRSGAEQSNTSIIIGGTLILKSFRKVEPGINPDVEISRFLTAKTDFTHIPLLAGTAEYRSPSFSAATALLQRYVPNRGNAWDDTLRQLEEFYLLVHSNPVAPDGPDSSDHPAMRALRMYATEAAGLGRITAQLHTALASDPGDPAFAPELITAQDIERWGMLIARQIESGIQALERSVPSTNPDAHSMAEAVIGHHSAFVRKVQDLQGLAGQAYKIRCHGDYHLGQVLKTDQDFYILDFEGEPLRSLDERREKNCSLRDVAGMLRSFHYAAYAGLFAFGERHGQDRNLLEPWARAWERAVSQSFLSGYSEEIQDSCAKLVPASTPLLARVLSVFVLEKAIYELNYELNNRPSWVKIPLQGVLATLEVK
jgi:maltose alpha-D-glucosyltransferase/alpha-amylase